MAKCITTYDGTEKNGNVMVTIINYLSNKGLTPNQIAGVMGSIALGNEDYKTDVDVEDSNKKKNAGLCQWKDDRRTKLMESAEKENKNWTDLVFQLDFAWSELTTNPSYKKNVLDWFKSHPNAGIKECVKRWEKAFDKGKGGKTAEQETYANDVLNFYNKYASSECSDVLLTNSNDDNKSNVDGEGTAGENIGNGSNDGTEVDNTNPSNPCNIRVNVINHSSSGGGDDNSNEGEDDGTDENNSGNLELNSTNYKGKSLELLLERYDFNCVRTISKLIDTTDGKNQFICYVVEDRVRYGPDGKCCKAKYLTGGNWDNGPNSSTAIPYGKYEIKLSLHREAYDRNGKKGHYYYGAYHKNTKYKGYIARFVSAIGKTGACHFDGVLIHASTDTTRGDQNNSGGCLCTGLKHNGSYLSQTQEAFHRLYDNYLIPATEAGSKIYVNIPRRYPNKDTGCYLSTNDMGPKLKNDKSSLSECARYLK